MDVLAAIVHDFGIWTLLLAAIAALITSSIHGSVGVAGGFLMTAVLAHLIGVKPVIPVMSVALVVSHGSRALLNFQHIDRRVCLAILLPAAPMIVVGGLIYGMLPAREIALVLGIVITASVPVRHWAQAHEISAGTRTLNLVGGAYGLLAGASTGSTMLISPFLLGTGVVKEAFVGTMAVIQMSSNVTRIGVFGTTHLLNTEYALLGLFVGLCMVPGNWIGRNLLRRMAVGTHSHLVDFFALIGAANFFYLAIIGR